MIPFVSNASFIYKRWSTDTKEQSVLPPPPNTLFTSLVKGFWTTNSALGRMPEFKGWPGRMGTLLRSGAPSNEQMKTKENEKRVEVGCELLTFWVSILDHLNGIIRADAISTLLWRSPEMGFGILLLFPPQQVLR